MVHITEIELKIHFEEDDFVNYLNNAKSEIILRNNNDEIEIEFMGSTINTTVNGYLGNFSKCRIISSGNLLGYLEAFRSNKSEYLLIYTNPK